jgi:hypothetical protein
MWVVRTLKDSCTLKTLNTGTPRTHRPITYPRSVTVLVALADSHRLADPRRPSRTLADPRGPSRTPNKGEKKNYAVTEAGLKGYTEGDIPFQDGDH